MRKITFFKEKAKFDGYFIKRAFDNEKQDLAVFNAKTSVLLPKPFYVVKCVMKCQDTQIIDNKNSELKGRYFIVIGVKFLGCIPH